MITTVTNLRTGSEWHYSRPPEQAVVCAHEQGTKGNWCVWTYDWTQVRRSGDTVVCGDWAARIRLAKTEARP